MSGVDVVREIRAAVERELQGGPPASQS